jgi:hypothetical protein
MTRLDPTNLNDKGRYPELTTLGAAIVNFQRILTQSGADAAMNFVIGCTAFTDEEKDEVLATV